MPAEDRPVRTYELDWHTVVWAMVGFAGLVAITALARSATRTVTWCVIGGLLALALNPLVVATQARLRLQRRGVAVAMVLAGFALVVTGITLILAPPALREARALQDDIPGVVEQLGDLPIIGDDLIRNDVPDRVQTWLEDLPSRLSGDTAPIEGAVESAVGGVLATTAVLLVTVTLLLDGARIARAVRESVPAAIRPRTDRVIDLFYRIVGRYFAGSVLVAAVAGVAVMIVGLSLGVPLTPLLAVWVALWDLVPQIGGAVGGVPFVTFGFTESAGVGLACLVFFILYLQFENHFFTPLVVGEAVDLSPPATMVAALVGVSAAGVPGALVAVPFLGVAKAAYLEVRHDPEARGSPASP